MGKSLAEILHSRKAYIFDMDGTLVDLENLNFTTFHQIVKEKLGKELTHDEYQKYFSGAGSRNGFARYTEAHSLNYPVGQLVDQYRTYKKDILATRVKEVVKVKDGAGELLDLLKEKGIKTALATSSFQNFATFIMKSFDLYDKFDLFLTEADIVKNKPDPEIFIKAQERLAVTKEECVIFEDSLNGIKSAKASGIFCIGIRNPGLNDNYVDQSDFVIDSFRDLVEAIRSDQ